MNGVNWPQSSAGWTLIISTPWVQVYRRNDPYAPTTGNASDLLPLRTREIVNGLARDLDRSHVPRLLEEFRQLRMSRHMNKLPTWNRGWAFGDEVPLRLPRRGPRTLRSLTSMVPKPPHLGKLRSAPRGHRPLRSRPGMRRRFLTSRVRPCSVRR